MTGGDKKGSRLIWIAIWAVVLGLLVGSATKRWSDRRGPFKVEEAFALPESDYRVQWPARVESTPERMRDFLLKHKRVDWLPLIEDDEEGVLHQVLSGVVKEGDGEAALLLGLRDLRNEGAVAESVAWLERGASRGNAEAQFLLGELVLIEGVEGIGKQDAMKQLELSAATGTPGARVLLGVIHQQEGRPVIAQQMMTQAAKSGDPEAHYHLALFNWNAIGRKPDERGMVLSLQEAAESGDVRAMHALGRCFEEGIGIRPAFEEALRWNQAAAALGYELAKRWCEARGRKFNRVRTSI